MLTKDASVTPLTRQKSCPCQLNRKYLRSRVTNKTKFTKNFLSICMYNSFSVMFEFLEYSLEHQLPNFSECWWDHWILDVIICNAGGTVIGLMTLRFLSIKSYNWRGLYNIPTYRGKIKRILAQFR